jgi:hypothetical protein
MADQELDKLKPDDPHIKVQNIDEQGEEEPNSLHNNQNIEFRLKNLVNITWVNRPIRLLAWSEERGSWYMWHEPEDPKKQST